jgi:hypothetical protein
MLCHRCTYGLRRTRVRRDRPDARYSNLFVYVVVGNRVHNHMLGRNPKTSYLYKAKMKYRDWSPHTVLKGDSVGQFSQYLYGDRLNSRLLHGYVLNFVEYLFVRCRLCTVGRERAIVLPTKPGPKFRNKRRCVVGPSQSRVSGSRHACIF